VNGNYAAVSGSPFIQGARVAGGGGSFTIRVVEDDGTVSASSGGGCDPLFVIAWGTP
jgi:hypothetical protein